MLSISLDWIERKLVLVQSHQQTGHEFFLGSISVCVSKVGPIEEGLYQFNKYIAKG